MRSRGSHAVLDIHLEMAKKPLRRFAIQIIAIGESGLLSDLKTSNIVNVIHWSFDDMHQPLRTAQVAWCAMPSFQFFEVG